MLSIIIYNSSHNKSANTAEFGNETGHSVSMQLSRPSTAKSQPVLSRTWTLDLVKSDSFHCRTLNWPPWDDFSPSEVVHFLLWCSISPNPIQPSRLLFCKNAIRHPQVVSLLRTGRVFCLVPCNRRSHLFAVISSA